MLKFHARKLDNTGFDLRAQEAGKEVGKIEGAVGKRFVRVSFIFVDSELRGGGAATELYEKAAKVACTVFGKPLASDKTRLKGGEGFWRKQAALGRAKCANQRGKACKQFVLPCSVKGTLAGTTRRKKTSPRRRREYR
jgi:hypothetical protein